MEARDELPHRVRARPGRRRCAPQEEGADLLRDRAIDHGVAQRDVLVALEAELDGGAGRREQRLDRAAARVGRDEGVARCGGQAQGVEERYEPRRKRHLLWPLHKKTKDGRSMSLEPGLLHFPIRGFDLLATRSTYEKRDWHGTDASIVD